MDIEQETWLDMRAAPRAKHRDLCRRKMYRHVEGELWERIGSAFELPDTLMQIVWIEGIQDLITPCAYRLPVIRSDIHSAAVRPYHLRTTSLMCAGVKEKMFEKFLQKIDAPIEIRPCKSVAECSGEHRVLLHTRLKCSG